MEKDEEKEINRYIAKLKVRRAFKFIGIGAAFLAAAYGIGTGIYVLTSIRKNEANENLPNVSQVQGFYEEIGCNTMYENNGTSMIFFSNKPFRMSVPSKPVKVNFNLGQLNDEQKQMFIDGTQEINEIFDTINPAYEFEVNFNPSKDDLKDKNNIDVSFLTQKKIEEAEEDLHLLGGQWNAEDLKYDLVSKSLTSENSEIYLHPDVFTFPNYGLGVYQHEFMHHLGLGDAYMYEDQVDCETVMNNHIQKESYIRKNDVALLAGKYGDYSTEEKKAALIQYINEYEANQKWAQKYFKDKQEIIEYFVSRGESEESISFEVQNSYAYFGFPVIPSLNMLDARYRFYSVDGIYKDSVSYNFVVNEDVTVIERKSKINNQSTLKEFLGLTFKENERCYLVKVADSLCEVSAKKDGGWIYDYLGTIISKEQYDDYLARVSEVFQNGTAEEADTVYDYISSDMKKKEKEAE